MTPRLVPFDTPNDGLPANWKPAEDSPLTAPHGAPPAAFVGASPFFAASIPLSSQLVPDIMPTRFPGGLGAYRVMPPIPAGVPGLNAAVRSIVIQETGNAAVPDDDLVFGGCTPLQTDYSASAADYGTLLSFNTTSIPPVLSYTGFKSASSTTASFTAVNTALGDLIVVGITYNSGVTILSVTDTAGNVYTQDAVSSTYNIGYSVKSATWSAPNCAANASNVIKVTASSSATLICFLWGFTNCAHSSAFDATAEGFSNNPSGPTTITTGSFTTIKASEIAVAFTVSAYTGSVWSAAGGYTTDQSTVDGSSMHNIFSSIQTGVTASMTQANPISTGAVIFLATYKGI